MVSILSAKRRTFVLRKTNKLDGLVCARLIHICTTTMNSFEWNGTIIGLREERA